MHISTETLREFYNLLFGILIVSFTVSLVTILIVSQVRFYRKCKKVGITFKEYIGIGRNINHAEVQRKMIAILNGDTDCLNCIDDNYVSQHNMTDEKHNHYDDYLHHHDGGGCYGINPSSGLPLSSSGHDIGGNPFGSSSGSYSDSFGSSHSSTHDYYNH